MAALRPRVASRERNQVVVHGSREKRCIDVTHSLQKDYVREQNNFCAVPPPRPEGNEIIFQFVFYLDDKDDRCVIILIIRYMSSMRRRNYIFPARIAILWTFRVRAARRIYLDRWPARAGRPAERKIYTTCRQANRPNNRSARKQVLVHSKDSGHKVS